MHRIPEVLHLHRAIHCSMLKPDQQSHGHAQYPDCDIKYRHGLTLGGTKVENINFDTGSLTFQEHALQELKSVYHYLFTDLASLQY